MNFFDYTSLNDAIPHGLTLIERLFPIILILVIIYSIFRFQDKIKNHPLERTLRYTIASLMVLGEISFITWNYVHSLNGDVYFLTTLPLQLCSYAIFGLFLSMFTLNRKLYSMVYVFGIVSVLALLFPNLNHGFNSFRYYQLYFSHGLLLISLLYLYKIKDFYPRKEDLIQSFILLQVIIVYSLGLNIWLDTDFLFIGPGNKPIDFAWEFPQQMIQYEAFMFLVYYLVYKILSKIKGDQYA